MEGLTRFCGLLHPGVSGMIKVHPESLRRLSIVSNSPFTLPTAYELQQSVPLPPSPPQTE